VTTLAASNNAGGYKVDVWIGITLGVREAVNERAGVGVVAGARVRVLKKAGIVGGVVAVKDTVGVTVAGFGALAPVDRVRTGISPDVGEGPGATGVVSDPPGVHPRSKSDRINNKVAFFTG
jgi:hypothetical protein